MKRQNTTLSALAALAALSNACMDDNGNNSPQTEDMRTHMEDMHMPQDMRTPDMYLPDMTPPTDMISQDMSPEIDMIPEDMKEVPTISLNISCQTQEECLQAIEAKKEEVAQAEEGTEFTYGFGLVAGLPFPDQKDKSILVANQWSSESDIFNTSATLLPSSRDVQVEEEGDCTDNCNLSLQTEIPEELLENLTLGVFLEFCNTENIPELNSQPMIKNNGVYYGETAINEPINLYIAGCLSISYQLVSRYTVALCTTPNISICSDSGHENNFAVNL